jgi:hypothetical protein
MQPLNSFPTSCGTRRFITAFTRALHLSLSWARPIQSTLPEPSPKRSVLILSTYLRLGLPSGFSTSGFPTNNICISLFPHSGYMFRPPHWLDYSNYNLRRVQIKKHYAAFSTLQSLHLFLVQISSSAPCSQILSAYVPPLVWEIRFHTHTKPQAKWSCIFQFLSFFAATEKTEGSGLNGSKHYPNSVSS